MDRPVLTMRRPRWVYVGLVAAAAFIAAAGALPYAGSWNDGSRLAPVETLVDYHTLSIDRSIFVDVPRPIRADDPAPYPADATHLMERGTCDKLFIDGHFYTDKPPVLGLLLAGVYQIFQWCGGPPARLRPDLFCYLMAVMSAGLAYVVAVLCTYRLAEAVGLPMRMCLALTASFGLATFALCYTRHVNNHIVMLGVVAPLFLSVVRSTRRAVSLTSLICIGSLAGLAYTIDVGPGPLLLVCLVGWIAYRWRRLSAVMVFGLAALPWLVLHHAVNYAIGGTLGPANTYPEYLAWPGSPFHAANLTGGWNHTPGHFIVYAAGLLFGKRGFLGHNLPLFLALAGLPLLWRRRPRETPELTLAAAFCAGTWLLFAALSNNYAGQCCSIRWFVPLLAPGYLVLAILLRDLATYRCDFLVLTAWGIILGGLMWWYGPWIRHMVPLFWPLQGAALASWIVCRCWRKRAELVQQAHGWPSVGRQPAVPSHGRPCAGLLKI